MPKKDNSAASETFDAAAFDEFVYKKLALGLIDPQNDFTSLTGARLPVPGGEEIVGPINELLKSGRYEKVFASKDWHPKNMAFFSEVNGLQPFVDQHPDEDNIPTDVYPRHCVADTWGAKFIDGIDPQKIDKVFPKGTSRTKDAYSAGPRIITYLRKQRITHVDLCGLVLRICVGYTALDLARAGFKVRIITDACRDLPEAVKFQAVLDELVTLGVEFITVEEALKQ